MGSGFTELRPAILSFVGVNNSGPKDEEAWRVSSKVHIASFRLKYLFRQSCSVFCTSVLNRIPSGMQVYAILFMLGMEQIAYSAASDYLAYPFLAKIGVGEQYLNLTRSMVMYIVANLLFPVAGWIIDVWVGQYRMLHFCLWLLWIGYALLAFLYSVYAFANWVLYLVPVLFALISLGHAGFQASAIPFGANSIRYRTSHELSSYFYSYYWVRNFGFIIYLFSAYCTKPNQGLLAGMYVMFAVLCITLALCLNGCFRNQFMADNERVNPYKKVVQVLYLAVVIKRPVYRSAFSFSGAKPPSRLNLTKTVHGGHFTSEEVEDVKTFLRLLGVLLFVFICLILYSGISQALPFQLHDMDAKILKLHFKIGKLGECFFSDRFSLLFNVSLILLLVPIVNSVLHPFLREYMPNMLKRIGVGSIMALLSLFSIVFISAAGNKRHWAYSRHDEQCMFSANFSDATVQDRYDYSHVSEFYVIIPQVLITLAEIFIHITSLEFFYAQSPHKMRGMMVGLFFFTWGAAEGLTQVFITAFSYRRPSSPLTCDFWYYLLYLCIAILGCVAYAVLVRRYTNRQRGEQESDLFYRPQD